VEAQSRVLSSSSVTATYIIIYNNRIFVNNLAQISTASSSIFEHCLMEHRYLGGIAARSGMEHRILLLAGEVSSGRLNASLSTYQTIWQDWFFGIGIVLLSYNQNTSIRINTKIPLNIAVFKLLVELQTYAL